MCCALRSETARCAHCPAASGAPVQRRVADPSGPAPVSVRPKRAAARPGAAPAQVRKLLRSLLPPGTREPASLLWHYTTQPIILRRRFPEVFEFLIRKEVPCMAKKRGEPRKYAIPTS